MNAPRYKVLIANRGEIALRIIRTCKAMDIETVAVYSECDAYCLHARFADQAICIGKDTAKESYLHVANIITAAKLTGCDAIHPGYGFLAERADFAQQVIDAGLTWIGPSPDAIRIMGDKAKAILTAKKSGLAIIPGSKGALPDDTEAVIQLAQSISYPVLLKAAAGGGGKGIAKADDDASLIKALTETKAYAKQHFNDATLYMEQYLENPRHVEIQILADDHGNVYCVGERDCSLQRNRQKIVEEGPCLLDSKAIAKARRQCIKLCKDIGYVGVGTVEFLVKDNQWYFMEMNTRIQVEHPVTEILTGLDLIAYQLQAHQNMPIQLAKNHAQNGYAIECRINAEHPTTFTPCSGTIHHFHAPGGPNVRIDTAIYSGYTVPHHYDSLICKIIVHQPTREQARLAMLQALHETVIDGIETNLPLLKKIIASAFFQHNHYHINSISEYLSEAQA